MDQQELLQKKQKSAEAENEEPESKDAEKDDNSSSNLCVNHTSLTKVLEQLNKFSEASLKMYEDIRHKGEAARIAYLNGKPRT